MVEDHKVCRGRSKACLGVAGEVAARRRGWAAAAAEAAAAAAVATAAAAVGAGWNIELPPAGQRSFHLSAPMLQVTILGIIFEPFWSL